MMKTTLASFALMMALAIGVLAQTAPSVRLSWDANTESDLAGYVLMWGTTPKMYTQSLPLPKTATTAEVTGLKPNTRYYFALRAFNTANAHSTYSNEVSVVAGSAVVGKLPKPTLRRK